MPQMAGCCKQACPIAGRAFGRELRPLAARHHFLAAREAEAKAGDDDGQMSLW